MRTLLAAVAVLALSACGAHEGAAVSDDAALTKCAGARLDAKGSCRHLTGHFAAKVCCAPKSAPTSRRDLEQYACPAGDAGIKVAFFDADSTLRVSKSGSVSANGPEDVNVLPFVAPRIAELNDQGFLVAIVSNQGGVASGHVTFAVAEGALLFTAEQIASLGGRVDYVDFAEKNDGFRKPKPGMADKLDELLEQRCGRGIDLAASTMVGDSGYKKGVDGPHPDGRAADDFSNTDRLFAENVGVGFAEPTDFFGWKPFGVMNLASEAELVDFIEAIEAEAAALAKTGKNATRRKLLEREAADLRRVNAL